MSRARRFFALPIAEQALLLHTAFLLAAIALSLRLLPFRLVRRLLPRAARPSSAAPGADPVVLARVERAVSTVSRLLLGPDSCLTQALAAQILLSRRGQPARLRIGVTKSPEGRLLAHAWVESGGTVIIGGPALSRYAPLPVFGEERKN